MIIHKIYNVLNVKYVDRLGTLLRLCSYSGYIMKSDLSITSSVIQRMCSIM